MTPHLDALIERVIELEEQVAHFGRAQHAVGLDTEAAERNYSDAIVDRRREHAAAAIRLARALRAAMDELRRMKDDRHAGLPGHALAKIEAMAREAKT